MALSFLGNIGKAIGGFTQAASPVFDIVGAIRGYKDQRGFDKQQNQLFQEMINRGASPEEQYAQSLYKALAQPDNSLVNQLQGEEYQLLMNAINEGIQQKVLSDRREAAMGRRPTYFDPERADENISYQLTRGAPAALLQARQNAQNRITEAASGVGGYSAASDKRKLSSLGARQDYLDLQRQGGSNKFKGIENLLGAIGTGLQKIPQVRTPGYNPNAYGPYLPPNMTALSNGETIRWNQMRYK